MLLPALLLPFLALCQITKERDVTASAGDYSTSPTLELSWTIGEVAVTSATVGNLQVSQGFQQADQNAVGIPETSFLGEIKVYPNPVSEVLNFQVRSEDHLELRAELFDINGRIVKEVPVFQVRNQFHGQIECGDLPAGQWFLRFVDIGNSVVKTFTVTKLD